MGIIDTMKYNLGFKDTIIYKENSDLKDKFNALTKLNEEYPDNKDLQEELSMVKKGLFGEDEVEYQLKKSNIGMYVLRDIKLEYEDLKAQIDYIVITPFYIYYIECKNLSGNITITENGDFINENIYNGKKIKKGIPSPLRQVEAQRDVIRKIWEGKASKIQKLFASNQFNHYRKVLVVYANQNTIINTNKAPKDIKNKILRADALVRRIEQDIENRNNDDLYSSKKEMEQVAETYLSLCKKEEINYYEYYKNKYIGDINDDLNVCPECGGELQKKKGKYGEFIGCSNYPDCNFTKKISN